jgi:hypothetical protein
LARTLQRINIIFFLKKIKSIENVLNSLNLTIMQDSSELGLMVNPDPRDLGLTAMPNSKAVGLGPCQTRTWVWHQT